MESGDVHRVTAERQKQKHMLACGAKHTASGVARPQTTSRMANPL